MNRILFLVESTESYHLLEQLLANHYSVELSEEGRLPEQSFDLIIVDNLMFNQYQEQLKARKEQDLPVFLPVFLLHSSNQKITNYHDFSIINDVLYLSSQQQEVLAKIDTFLYFRKLSLDLSTVNEELKNLKQFKKRLIMIAAHDLRNPLSVIFGNVQLLERYYEKLEEAKRTKMFRQIHTSVKNIINLLDDILIIDKVEEDNLNFKPSLINLASFCQDIVAELKLNSSKNNLIDFIVQEPLAINNPKPEMVYLDEKLLRYILINLLANLIKRSTSDSKICLETGCQESEVILLIKSYRLDIKTQKTTRLSEIFSNEKISESSLDLTIIQKCIELHEGSITIDSQEKVEITITLKFPSKKKLIPPIYG